MGLKGNAVKIEMGFDDGELGAALVSDVGPWMAGKSAEVPAELGKRLST